MLAFGVDSRTTSRDHVNRYFKPEARRRIIYSIGEWKCRWCNCRQYTSRKMIPDSLFQASDRLAQNFYRTPWLVTVAFTCTVPYCLCFLFYCIVAARRSCLWNRSAPRRTRHRVRFFHFLFLVPEQRFPNNETSHSQLSLLGGIIETLGNVDSIRLDVSYVYKIPALPLLSICPYRLLSHQFITLIRVLGA